MNEVLHRTLVIKRDLASMMEHSVEMALLYLHDDCCIIFGWFINCAWMWGHYMMTSVSYLDGVSTSS